MSAPRQRPPSRSPRAPDRAAPSPPRGAPAQPLSDREIDELQQLLDGVPAPLEPLDVSMLDGFLCALLVQPRSIPPARWLPYIVDVDGRALPPRFDSSRIHTLALRRHAELDDAIQRRQWFDPWVFELTNDEAEAEAVAAEDEDDDFEPSSTDAVYPWVAGFATALELFPELMAMDAKVLNEPLALVYRHLAPDDLEDADDLLAEIESLEPPADLAEAVEGLVQATLLIADISRPLPANGTAPQGRPNSAGRPGERRVGPAPGRRPRGSNR
jgi:uncharacterized protein